MGYSNRKLIVIIFVPCSLFPVPFYYSLLAAPFLDQSYVYI
ncbi:hypothetical protein BJP36_40810 [Moorena producens JHB]|uniref:Uncharacterized protein n=1 Tax=Moorena producens (strain JHB) TaxID=1454205 RepID=A0A9Q9SS80_MOOP1|nr:hypothetical protein [Moorena producens]WAN68707.1 hypothetical protein BJP36_40810 [Moorena producens JHB]